jgi:hypothetical protein
MVIMLCPQEVNLETFKLEEHIRNTPCTNRSNQEILEAEESEVEFYSPFERWRNESREEAPWHLINFDEPEWKPRAKL